MVLSDLISNGEWLGLFCMISVLFIHPAQDYFCLSNLEDGETLRTVVNSFGQKCYFWDRTLNGSVKLWNSLSAMRTDSGAFYTPKSRNEDNGKWNFSQPTVGVYNE